MPNPITEQEALKRYNRVEAEYMNVLTQYHTILHKRLEELPYIHPFKPSKRDALSHAQAFQGLQHGKANKRKLEAALKWMNNLDPRLGALSKQRIRLQEEFNQAYRTLTEIQSQIPKAPEIPKPVNPEVAPKGELQEKSEDNKPPQAYYPGNVINNQKRMMSLDQGEPNDFRIF